MAPFADTSFLFALHRQQKNSEQAIAAYRRLRASPMVTIAVLYEFRQSIWQQIFLFARDRSKGFSQSAGGTALANLDANLAAGALEATMVDWPRVFGMAQDLATVHTRTSGIRAMDLLHIASALHLGAKEFLSFDAAQCKVAEAVGMKVRP